MHSSDEFDLDNMSGNFVFVAREEGGEPMRFPLGEDGTVSFSTLRAMYPRVICLVYRIEDENFISVVPVNESGFHPPHDGWGQRIYWCIFSEEDRNNKRKCDATTSVSSVAKANRQEITPETLTGVIDQIDRSEAATPTMSNNQHEREAQYTLTSSPTMIYVTALSRIGFNWERIFFKLGIYNPSPWHHLKED
ncbi:uncharacterized protein LOC116350109 isoform X3 [Contarinia nasturtii]|uniref:uncharacterized protein LOC116350109 isoform X3 n=1 Tax=Contarinia nasturtii TaxID=265458 RepID=UPI0012D45E5C|nr:uncharacterized protein LOC116350109 isoform X3 [Contarinia nasturtii]